MHEVQTTHTGKHGRLPARTHPLHAKKQATSRKQPIRPTASHRTQRLLTCIGQATGSHGQEGLDGEKLQVALPATVMHQGTACTMTSALLLLFCLVTSVSLWVPMYRGLICWPLHTSDDHEHCSTADIIPINWCQNDAQTSQAVPPVNVKGGGAALAAALATQSQSCPSKR